MEEWFIGHRRLAVALALVLEWAVLVAVGLALRRTPIDAIMNSVVWTVMCGMVLAFELRRKARIKVQLDMHGQVLVYVRYPDSLRGSLSGIWNLGIAKPSGKCIDFQPAAYDTSEPSGRPTKRPQRSATRRFLKGMVGVCRSSRKSVIPG